MPILIPGKQPQRAHAKSLACYEAVRELGMTAVAISRLLGITYPEVTKAAVRGEELANDQRYKLITSEK
jgi:putative transposase